MDKTKLIQTAVHFVETSPDNRIAKDVAITPQLAGMKIFEKPLLAFGSASDPYFNEFKRAEAIGNHFWLPCQWLPQAKTVIAVFLPFSPQVKKSNNNTDMWPSPEWLHGRIEGQAFINQFAHHLQSLLQVAGHASIAPSLSREFWTKKYFDPDTAHPEVCFTSNWSERHAAFICGLGTFGLSKGLITKQGMAGRLTSIITELELSPDLRNYHDIYEYCSRCGACTKKCPAGAISLTTGKNHELCAAFLDKTSQKYAPRYGCGKCQTGVPCESKLPLPIK